MPTKEILQLFLFIIIGFDNLKKFIELDLKKIITYNQTTHKLKNTFSYKIIRVITKKILQIKRLIG